MPAARVRRRSAAALAAPALLLGVAGCADDGGNGIADESPEDALERAVEAAREAGSVRLQGGSAGEDGGTSLDLDLQVDAEEGATGTLTLDGGSADIRFDGQRAFLQGDNDFWASSGAPPEAVELLAGQFVEAPAFVEGLRQLTDFTALVDELAEPEGELRSEGVTEVDGQELLELVSDDGSLFLSTVDEPYPLLLRDAAEDGSGDLELSDWGLDVVVEIPEGAPTVDELLADLDAAEDGTGAEDEGEPDEGG